MTMLRLFAACCFVVCLLGTAAPEPVLRFAFDGTAEATVGSSDVEVAKAPTFVAGKQGQAIHLGDGDWLKISLPPSIAEKGAYTIAFWLKPLWHPQDGLPHPIMEIPAKPDTYDAIRWSATQMLLTKGWSESIGQNAMYGVTSSDVATRHLTPGKWTFVVLVYDLAGKYRASYFDGEGARRAVNPDQPLDVYGNELWVGSRAGGRGSADVEMDELQIFDQAIAPADIETIAGTTFPTPLDLSTLGKTVDLKSAVETPHHVWAKPFAGGPIRLLLITEPQRSRELIELAQRLEIEPRIVVAPELGRHINLNPEEFVRLGQQVEAALKEPLDCVVIGAYGWNLFPETTRAALMAYLRQGGGLLFAAPRCVSNTPVDGMTTNYGPYWAGWVGTPLGNELEALASRLDRADEEYLTANVPWEALPVFANQLVAAPPSAWFRGGQVGEGRLLLYDLDSDAHSQTSLTPGIAYTRPFDAFGYDYAMSSAAKAVIWTARKVSPVRLSSLRFVSRHNFKQVNIGLRGGFAFDLVNDGDKPVGVRLRLSLKTRDPDAPTVIEQTHGIPPGTRQIILPWTVDRLGTVFADASVEIDGEVADWATTTVEAERGNPYLRGLKADREWYAAGDQPMIEAEVYLRSYGAKPGVTGQLTWHLYDNASREVARDSLTVLFSADSEFPTDLRFRLPALGEASRRYRLIVDLAGANGKTSDRRTMSLYVRPSPVDDVLLYTWHAGDTVTAALAAQVLHDDYGLQAVSCQVRGQPVGDYLQNQLDWIAGMNMQPWLHATSLGGHPDDQGIRRPDMSDLERQAELAKRLKGMAKVATPYSPLFYSLGDETKLGPPTAQPSGLERDAFRRWLMVRYASLEALNAAWKTSYASWNDVMIPDQAILASGEANSQLMAELLTFRNSQFAAMIGSAVDAVREVDPQAKVGIEGIHGLGHPWGAFDYEKVTHRSTYMGQYALGRELDMVRSFAGPDTLVGCWYNYQVLDRGYSLYGPWHAVMRGVKTFGWFTSYEASPWTALNPDLTAHRQWGWTYEELAPLQAGIGKLILGLERDAGVSILYEYRNLHRSSQQYHGMLVMTTLLEDLGVNVTYLSADDVAAGALKMSPPKALILAGQLVMKPEAAEAIKGYVSGGGTVLADMAPATSDGLNRYAEPPLQALFEQPGALLLGDPAEAYLRDRFRPAGEAIRQQAGDFLIDRGATSAFVATPVDGHFRPLTVVSYIQGDARYVGLQRDYKTVDQAPAEFTVSGPEAAHIYDVRFGKYLGFTNSAKVTLSPSLGALYAFLPWRVTGLRVELPATCRAGDSLTMRCQLLAEGTPGEGVMRLDVLDPDGKRNAMLSRKVRTHAGFAAVPLDLAYNDMPGEWSIVVTDIATGASTTKKLHLTPLEVAK